VRCPLGLGPAAARADARGAAGRGGGRGGGQCRRCWTRCWRCWRRWSRGARRFERASSAVPWRLARGPAASACHAFTARLSLQGAAGRGGRERGGAAAAPAGPALRAAAAARAPVERAVGARARRECCGGPWSYARGLHAAVVRARACTLSRLAGEASSQAGQQARAGARPARRRRAARARRSSSWRAWRRPRTRPPGCCSSYRSTPTRRPPSSANWTRPGCW